MSDLQPDIQIGNLVFRYGGGSYKDGTNEWWTCENIEISRSLTDRWKALVFRPGQYNEDFLSDARRISAHPCMNAPIDSIVTLGVLIKRRNVSMEITYGSGGFSVVLRSEKGAAYGCAWDLPDAVDKAFDKLSEVEVEYLVRDYVGDDAEYEDEPTRPDLKISITRPEDTKKND